MQSSHEFPYPTFIEWIRALARILDIKYSNKALDDKAYERMIDPRQVHALAKECIDEPLQRCIGQPGAELVARMFTRMRAEYVQLVAQVDADGVTRADMLPLLLNGFFKQHLVDLLNEVHTRFGGPSPVTMVIPGENAVDIVLTWVSKHEPDWELFYKSLNKEWKDRLSAWRRLDSDIPSSQSIQLLPHAPNSPDQPSINWERLQLLLLIARGVEALKRQSSMGAFFEAVRLSLWGAVDSFDLSTSIKVLQSAHRLQVSSVLKDIARIQNELKRTNPKPEHHRDQLRQSLNRIRSAYESIKSGYTTRYWLDWHEARWHLLSGDLEAANDFYRKAAEDCLFRAGENQQLIINESLVVAAAQKRPDKVFLKHLKNACTTFGYDIPSVTDPTPSNKFDDTVEQWEIEQWKAQFYRLFPQQGFFPECSVEVGIPRIGPLIITDMNKNKPDYKKPDRTIKIGDTWQKRLPQLVWFAEIENFEATSNLLKKGASVDCFSESDDSPILMALQALNITSVPFASLDGRFFDLISQYPHTPETLNKRTQKKRLLPIISAVESGQPEVVEKVLAMGADPNGRGGTDEQTALNVCLKYISYIKCPVKFMSDHREVKFSPAALDSIRRYSAGVHGHTLADQKRAVEAREKHPQYGQFRQKILEAMIGRINEYMSLESMRQIAGILIDAGADVNAEHRSPLAGYTPLMLAAELNERKLFEHMLVKGGDLNKTYVDPRTARAVDCWEIANYFNSYEVSTVLTDIAPYWRTSGG